MREIIELTQDEIDSLVQAENAFYRADYNSLRALQDGIVDIVKLPFVIYKRKKEL